MAGYRLRKGFGYRAAVVYLVLLALGGAGCRRVPTAARVTPVRPPAPDTRPVVCIDPGHPTENNSGRTVQNGTTELAVNWEVAGALQSLLAEDGRIRVVKTRARRDQFMRTRERARVANACRADLALHLHCDTGAGSGYTVYYPDRRGRAEGRTGPSPAVIRASRQAALAVHKGMARVLRGALPDQGIRGESRTHLGRRIGVLPSSVFSEVPTVTVEMVFLSNPRDARFIRSAAGRRKMAEALAAGVREALGRK